jgi:hypothetical protein
MDVNKFIKLCNERLERLQMSYSLNSDHIECKILQSQMELLANLIEDLEESK